TEAKKVQESVGYLPEHNPLYTDLYVREYLAFNADVYRVSKSRIQEVIELTGLTPEAHKKIGQLSKGYRQRVGIATALLHNPEVLILDEPTTGLDPNQLVEIRELIKNIGKDKTVFLSTHIMQEVEAICDRVIIINHGKIVTDKKLDKLMVEEKSLQVLEVEFNQEVEKDLLGSLNYLTQACSEDSKNWVLVFETDVDMRPVLFDFAAAHGLKTLQLSQKTKNLEAIFREKTK
ncbi:MAG: ATP-binding cassette domain-containing protein, partial [Flavobacterium sp.]